MTTVPRYVRTVQISIGVIICACWILGICWVASQFTLDDVVRELSWSRR